MTAEYLPLAEYSTKYRVSISTLRRKIKARDIEFVFSENKYLILDQPPTAHQRHRPSPTLSESALMGAVQAPRIGAVVVERAPLFSAPAPVPAVARVPVAQVPKATEEDAARLREQFLQMQKKLTASKAHEESVVSAANKLLADLKKAYSQILQDKEEQILAHRQEIADLKTLVQVLESENARLQGKKFST